MTMRRAMIAAGVVVALAEGGSGGDMLSEMLAITQKVRGAGLDHPNQLVRELAAMAHFQSGMRPDMRRGEYEEQALPAMRAAAAMVKAKAPGDLTAYRSFLLDLAETAASAHKEGGIRVTPAEAAAVARVRKALGIP